MAAGGTSPDQLARRLHREARHPASNTVTAVETDAAIPTMASLSGLHYHVKRYSEANLAGSADPITVCGLHDKKTAEAGATNLEAIRRIAADAREL